MASIENPYEAAGLGEGMRSCLFNSFATSFDAQYKPEVAKAAAFDAFIKWGAEEEFKQIIEDVWVEHFQDNWTVVNLVSLEEDEPSDNVIANLIPNGKKYMEQGKNCLLIGPHGTGKTYSIMEIVEDLGWDMAYFSCSTMDVYTDLIGVPVPKEDEGIDYLKMVRPHAIDKAQIIFFDEFNRADSQIMNAVFEIIQFGTINGEKLPNLRCCWAAMNPADGDYTVSETDPALLDRFHAYIKMEPKPSVAYMAQYMDKKVAKAIVRWWTMHETKQKNQKLKKERMAYISPRRLVMIGEDWMMNKNGTSIMRCLPPSGEFDHTKLIDMLESASGLKQKNESETAKALGFPVEKGFIKANEKLVGDTIKDDITSQIEVINCLFRGTGPMPIREQYDSFINSYCTAAAVEAAINELTPTKRSNLKGEYCNYHPELKDSLIYRALAI